MEHKTWSVVLEICTGCPLEAKCYVEDIDCNAFKQLMVLKDKGE